MAKGHGGQSGHSNRGSGAKSGSPLTKEAASRIQSAGDRNPGARLLRADLLSGRKVRLTNAGSNSSMSIHPPG
jgi:hypothetical protein